MATLDEQGRPIITLGNPAKTYLMADLKQIYVDGTYRIKKKSDNENVGDSIYQVEGIDTEV